MVSAGSTADDSALTGIRVLVVDDDVDLLDSICDVLESYKAACVRAHSGPAGYETFLHERPDVVISDLWMPGGDGFDMIARIRALPPEQGGLTPAIAISAAENAKSAIMAGFHAFTPKPFDVDKLVATLVDFTRPRDDAQSVAPWTLTPLEPGSLVVTFSGSLRAADIRHMMEALVVHLEDRPCAIIADLRRITDFAPSVASVAERGAWRLRHRITSCRIVGGSFLARVMVAASAKVLGVPYVLADEL